MPRLEIFREKWRGGVRILTPDHERSCDRGAAISCKIGIGLFAPELRIEWGAFTRQIWHDRRTGKRFDFGYGFERGEWVNLYGISGRRWDRVIRIALMRYRRAVDHRRAGIEAAAAEAAAVDQIPF